MKTKIPSVCVLFVFYLTGCATTGDNKADRNDPTGVYTLVAVNGIKLPAGVLHGETEIKVHAGTFTIKADGTCSTQTVFGPPSGNTVTREVSATYTQEGSTLKMQWQGAGRTEGTIQGDSFDMNNEGMIFSYKKQSGQM